MERHWASNAQGINQSSYFLLTKFYENLFCHLERSCLKQLRISDEDTVLAVMRLSSDSWSRLRGSLLQSSYFSFESHQNAFFLSITDTVC